MDTRSASEGTSHRLRALSRSTLSAGATVGSRAHHGRRTPGARSQLSGMSTLGRDDEARAMAQTSSSQGAGDFRPDGYLSGEPYSVPKTSVVAVETPWWTSGT